MYILSNLCSLDVEYSRMEDAYPQNAYFWPFLDTFSFINVHKKVLGEKCWVQKNAENLLFQNKDHSNIPNTIFMVFSGAKGHNYNHWSIILQQKYTKIDLQVQYWAQKCTCSMNLYNSFTNVPNVMVAHVFLAILIFLPIMAASTVGVSIIHVNT